MSLATPALVIEKLEEIEMDLALLQNSVEDAALNHFRMKREREKERARSFLAAKGTDFARREKAAEESAGIGVEEEGIWEGKKAVLKALEARATIGQSILRSQGRV